MKHFLPQDKQEKKEDTITLEMNAEKDLVAVGDQVPLFKEQRKALKRPAKVRAWDTETSRAI